MKISVYTDGSAVVSGKFKGRGGFATYFPNLFGNKKVYSKGFINTKTGRMEIMALLYAIKAIPTHKALELNVYSDSQYVVKSFTENRLEKWVSNDWASYGNEVKNVDLWKKVLKELGLRKKLTLYLHHIKSHQYDSEKDPIKKKELLKNEHILGNTIADYFANYKNFNENELKTDL